MKKFISLSLALALILMVACVSAESVYPLEGDKQFSLYSVGGWGMHSDYVTYDESPLHQFIEEATGVDITWERAAAGADENMAFNMVLAGTELPDIVYNWNIPANASSLIDEGILVPLEDYMEEYAPALTAYLNEHPEIKKACTTDDGHMYFFPFLYEDPLYLGTTTGLSVNTELLEKAGLAMPETIADWEAVFAAFKEMDECDYPLSVYNPIHLRSWFGNAFGFNGADQYYVDADGNVATWINAEGYKDFLTLMNKWYNEGILDKDFATTNIQGLASKIVATKIGAYYGGLNTPARFYNEIVARDGKWTYAPVQQTVMNVGDPVLYAQGSNGIVGAGAYITTDCEDIEGAMRFLDYGYTKEGMITWNYGKEGVSFEYDANGQPVIYDSILNAAEGSTVALSRYTAMVNTGISIQMVDWFNQKSLDIVPVMIEAWTKNSQAFDHHFPAVSATPEETAEQANLESAILTYANEMYLNFIIGTEPLENYDQYIETLESMGIDRLLEIKGVQVERFNNR